MRPVASPAAEASFPADGDAEPETAWEPSPVGFPLVITGLAAFTLGVFAFLWGQNAPGMAKYAWREVAGVTVGLALPFFLAGIHVAFPSRSWARVLAVLGAGATLAGIAVFAYLYPYNWNVAGRDGSPYGLVPYGAGILAMGAAAFMNLLDAYLDVRAGNPVGTRVAEAEVELTDEEIARDLENAGRSRLTWGGFNDHVGPKLRIQADPLNTRVLHGKVGRAAVLEDLPISTEVSKLQAFRGGSVRATEADDESPAAALLALRDSKEVEEVTRAQQTLLERMSERMRTFLDPWGVPASEPTRPEAASASLIDFTVVRDAAHDPDDPWAHAAPAAGLLPALDALAGVRDGTAPPRNGGSDPPKPSWREWE